MKMLAWNEVAVVKALEFIASKGEETQEIKTEKIRRWVKDVRGT